MSIAADPDVGAGLAWCAPLRVGVRVCGVMIRRTPFAVGRQAVLARGGRLIRNTNVLPSSRPRPRYRSLIARRVFVFIFIR